MSDRRYTIEQLRGAWAAGKHGKPFKEKSKPAVIIRETRDERILRQRQEHWEKIVAIEPRLLPLLEEAKSHHESKAEAFCANLVFFGRGGIKYRLSKLVGYESANPLLRNSLAYDVAYDVIYDALPDCRKCWCG